MADGKVGRPKGLPRYGGRKKGTPNKVNKDLRERISMFLDDNFDDAMKAWKNLEDKDKVKMYTDLIKFSVPTLQAVSLDANIKKEDSVEDDLKELAQE